MTRLKLYYDGWLALPAALRRQLNLGTGDVLDADLVDGVIVLRPRERAKVPAAPQPAPKRGKCPDARIASSILAGPGAEAGSNAVPNRLADPVPAVPGEPGPAREVAGQLEPSHEAGSALGSGSPAGLSIRSELRRKVVLPTASHDPGVAVRGRRPEHSAHDSTGYERERRPFRQVEVRQLGPGRGPGKSRPRMGEGLPPRS